MKGKFEKLDPKQVPQMLGLAGLCTVAFGFAAYSLVQLNKPVRAQSEVARPAVSVASKGAAAEVKVDKPADGATAPGAPGAVDPSGKPAGAPGAEKSAAGLSLPATYNPDPFKPAVTPKSSGPAAAKPAPAPHKGGHGGTRMAQGLPLTVPGLPPAGVGPALGSSSGSYPGAPTVPSGPARPDVALTGVIKAEDGANMALVDVGTEHRIVQAGDVLPNSYKVKRIGMDGILLVSGKDRYFVPLGNKAPGVAASAAPSGMPARPVPAIPESSLQKPGA